MTKKYSSDDKLQTLFEGFRKYALNEGEEHAEAASRLSRSLQMMLSREDNADYWNMLKLYMDGVERQHGGSDMLGLDEMMALLKQVEQGSADPCLVTAQFKKYMNFSGIPGFGKDAENPKYRANRQLNIHFKKAKDEWLQANLCKK